MEKSRIFGIAEPVWFRDDRGDIDGVQAVEIMDAIGFTAFREWIHIPYVLSDPKTPKPEVVARMTEILNKAVELDIEITGMSHNWFLPEGCVHREGHFMPERDTTPGSLYMQTLEMLEESWATLTALFPQVKLWEVGNEWNIFFLSKDTAVEDPEGPHGWRDNFTLDERADIAVDLLYYAARGVRRGNPEAKVVMAAACTCEDELPWFVPAKYGIANFLERIYERIYSGKYPSTNTDDYFDLLAWHPYTSHDVMPNGAWKEANDAAYRVMEKYGDGHKKVLITEFGYSDSGNEKLAKEQARYYKKIFKMLKQMPYVRTLHVFRLYEDAKMSENWIPGTFGGPYEQYFGIFTEPKNGQLPRLKAIELQKLTGSTKDLYAFRTDGQ